MEYDSNHARCQALNSDSQIEEFTFNTYTLAMDDEAAEMGACLNPFQTKRRFSEKEMLLRLQYGSVEGVLPVIFDETSAVLEKPQRVEYSAVDGKIHLYQYSISANYQRLMNTHVDTSSKGETLVAAEGTDHLLGHGEFTGPAVIIRRMSGDPDNSYRCLSQKAVAEAERRFPAGYILISDVSEAGKFSLTNLRGIVFDASESDEVVSVDDKGFVLKDTGTDEGSRGERRIEYPHVKGIVIRPDNGFSSSGHHLEGVIEANTLGVSADFDPLKNPGLFDGPLVVEETESRYGQPPTTAKYEVYLSRQPMRLAVDGGKRKAVLHTVT